MADAAIAPWLNLDDPATLWRIVYGCCAVLVLIFVANKWWLDDPLCQGQTCRWLGRIGGVTVIIMMVAWSFLAALSGAELPELPWGGR